MKLLTLLIRPYLSHKFFGCKHELVVDHPSWLLLEQAAVRVNLDCLKSKGKKKRKEKKQNIYHEIMESYTSIVRSTEVIEIFIL